MGRKCPKTTRTDNTFRAESNQDMSGGANIFNLLSEKLSKLLLPLAKKALSAGFKQHQAER
jgi:hypothetical protein